MYLIKKLKWEFFKQILGISLFVVLLLIIGYSFDVYILTEGSQLWNSVLQLTVILLLLAPFYYVMWNKQKKLEKTVKEFTIKHATLKTILENMSDGVAACDMNSNFTFFNERAQEILGLPQKNIPPEQWGDYYGLYREDGKTPLKAEEVPLYKVLHGQEIMNEEISVKKENGELRNILVNGKQMTTLDSEEIGALVVFHDFTERKIEKKKFEHLSYHDALTGLPNRRYFKRLLQKNFDLAKHEQQQIAVMYIDMDGFKLINDTLGHDKGDIYLQRIAERLQNCIRQSDVVARIGGDEFTVILTNATTDGAKKVAEKILQDLSIPILLEGHELASGLSIGISLYPNDGKDIETIMKNADTAMYHVKNRGKNNYMFYEAHMKNAMFKELESTFELK